jgi:hypothetical protein
LHDPIQPLGHDREISLGYQVTDHFVVVGVVEILQIGKAADSECRETAAHVVNRDSGPDRSDRFIHFIARTARNVVGVPDTCVHAEVELRSRCVADREDGAKRAGHARRRSAQGQSPSHTGLRERLTVTPCSSEQATYHSAAAP